MKRQEAYEALNWVQNQYEASRFALTSLLRVVSKDPTVLPRQPHQIRPSHVRDAAANLEDTYLLRLFAEFESTLRNYWASIRPSPRVRRTRIEILINRVAAWQDIPDLIIDHVHAVREYRNHLVHRGGGVPAVTLAESKSVLARFISFLPLQW